MKQYDAVFIFTPGSESITTVKEEVTNQFKKSKFKIVDENDMGERDLAYEIKKNERGHYIRFIIEGEAEKLNSIEEALRLNTGILKFVFFRHE